ncbi:ubiquitin C-terminal hydrolase L3 [Coprinopsis sp. MPI-PUGE-AT-0042]|nr:ubiquitin C-terminal hydrolase L3 [Coprinopsis sp. MPI-PUGE-AT-0042]
MSESELSPYERTKPNYRKYYVPLESDPEIFTELIQNLGVRGYEFQDVYSLDDPDLLSFIPRPVYALILTFPEAQMDKEKLNSHDTNKKVYDGKGEGEPTIWYSQTIQNACGLYAVLHAVSNGVDRTKIESGSTLDNFLKQITPLAPYERALALEASSEIEAAHASAATKGGTEAPAANSPDVVHHYTCFVRSKADKHIYDMNGCFRGPVDTGIVQEEEDVLTGEGIGLIKEYIKQAGENVGFNLLALVGSS